MSFDFETIKELLCEAAKRQKIAKFDVFGSIIEKNAASSRERKPFAVSASQRISLKIRVWNEDNKVGIATTSALNHEGIFEAMGLALAAARYIETVKVDFSPRQAVQKTSALSSKELAPISLLVEEAIKNENNILSQGDFFKSVPYNKIGESREVRFYFNSKKTALLEQLHSAYCYFYPLAQEKEKKSRQAGHTFVAANFAQLNVQGCAEKAVEKTKKHLDYKQVKSGKYLVVFSGEAFLDLLNAFGNIFNAQNILDNKSLMKKEQLNTAIASTLLSIHDVPQHAHNISPVSFDEEGTPTGELALVESGRLLGLLQSSATAPAFHTTPTGHTTLGAKLTLSPHFLHVFPSQIQEKRKHEADFIYVDSIFSLHAGVNALQGSFSLPFHGWIVENGHFTSIEAATVAGDFLDVLKNICYVSDTPHILPAGVCPEIWVENLSITGN